MESVAFIQWSYRPPQLLDNHAANGYRKFLHPLPLGSGGLPAAYKAAGANSDLNVFLVVLFATLGANIGALINYYIAYFVGRPLVYKFANSRFGHMCLIDEAKVQHAERYFDRHGGLSTFIGRLIPAVRQLISIPAGLARMKLSTFLIYTTLESRHMERHPGRHRILPAVRSARRTAAGDRDPIQPRTGILLHSPRSADSGIPHLQGKEINLSRPLFVIHAVSTPKKQ